MCGFVGLIGREQSFCESRWKLAQYIQQHRGPDGRGESVEPVGEWSVFFAHQRLAIIDLSDAGRQPLSHPANRNLLVYNGEIYNYLELRNELIAAGYRFETKTDSEVLLVALDHWGVTEALRRCNGMWAFAYLERDKKRIWLARDRCGEKPLYWHTTNDNFYFASEMKTLLSLANKRFVLDVQPLGEYLLQSLLDASSDTFFRGIKQITPGTVMCINLATDELQGLTEEVYWQPSFFASEISNEKNAIEHLRSLFFDSVRIRLRSDVPVGVLLSGGIDSSSIAAAVQKINGKDSELNLLSAVSGDHRFDESPFIDAMAKHLRRPVEKIVLDLRTDEALDLLERVVWSNDAPVGSFANVAHYLLMQEAKEKGITVILSGQGADELLCGYKKYLGFYIQSLLRQRKLGSAGQILFDFWKNGSILKQFSFSEAKRYLPGWAKNNTGDIRGEKLMAFKPAFLGIENDACCAIQKRQLLDLKKLSVPTLNHFEDRMSMAFSREIRLPFLDVRLIERLIPLPAKCKLNQGWTKYIFRKAMEPYLPQEITWRKDKQGFVNPQSEWLKRELKHRIIEDYFSPESLIFRYRLVERNSVLKLYEDYCRQPANAGRIWFKDIFNPLALEIWLRKFDEFIAAP